MNIKPYLIFVILLLPFNANSATLDIVGDQVLGATGVDVLGNPYDVAFTHGSCDSLWSGCDPNFMPWIDGLIVTTADMSAWALAASDSLANLFNTTPGFNIQDMDINGCKTPGFDQCLILTPERISFSLLDNVVVRLVYPGPAATGPYTGIGTSSHYDPGIGRVWASWTPVSPVPLPPAFLLFGSALVGLTAFSKRRKAA